MLSNNTIVMYNNTNQAEWDTVWTSNDRRKIEAFVNQLILARKIIFTFIAIFTVLGNTLILVATWRERSLHQPNKYFIACLAVADLLVGMFLEPLILYQLNLDKESKLSIHLCRFMIWIDTLALTASVYSLTFISYDRYLKISKPLQYQSRTTTSKSLKVIFAIWLISTAFATYAATPDSGSLGILYTSGAACPCDESKMKGFYTFVAVSTFFLPTIVILAMYALIFVVAHKRQKMLQNGELGRVCNDQNQRTVFRQDLKVIRMLLVVVGVFILCWSPYFFYMLVFYYYPNYNSKLLGRNSSLGYWYRRWTTETIILALPYINSMCNPIIYACLDQKYREAFKNLFQRMMWRLTSSRRRSRQTTETMGLRPLNTE